MTFDELRHLAIKLESEIARGIRFYCATEGDHVIGVMGIQDVKDVTLIRHAYVRTAARRHGIERRQVVDHADDRRGVAGDVG